MPLLFLLTSLDGSRSAAQVPHPTWAFPPYSDGWPTQAMRDYPSLAAPQVLQVAQYLGDTSTTNWVACLIDLSWSNVIL